MDVFGSVDAEVFILNNVLLTHFWVSHPIAAGLIHLFIFLQRVNGGQVGDCWHGAYWIYLVYFFLKSFPLRGQSSSFLFKCKAQSEKNLKSDLNFFDVEQTKENTEAD